MTKGFKIPPEFQNEDGTPDVKKLLRGVKGALIDSNIRQIEHEIASEKRNPVPQSERRIAKAQEMLADFKRKLAAHWGH